jgi:hypothetical protein
MRNSFRGRFDLGQPTLSSVRPNGFVSLERRFALQTLFNDVMSPFETRALLDVTRHINLEVNSRAKCGLPKLQITSSSCRRGYCTTVRFITRGMFPHHGGIFIS